MSYAITKTSDTSLKHLNMLVHGQSGTGKTWLAGTTGNLAKTLLLDVEAGTLTLAHLDIDTVPIRNVETLRKVVGDLIKGKLDYEWVILDSLSEVAELFLEDAKANNKHGLKAYGETQDKVMWLVKALKNLPMHTVLLSKQGVDEDGLQGPKMTGRKLGPLLPYQFDLVGAMRMQTVDDGTIKRALQFGADGRFHCKARGAAALGHYEKPDLAAIAAKVLNKEASTDA